MTAIREYRIKKGISQAQLELAKLNTENFGSLRDYFRRLLEYTDVTKRQIIETVGQSADHCFRFGSTQWLLPTREAITETMRETSIENAEKFLNALRGALSAILANLEGGGSDVG